MVVSCASPLRRVALLLLLAMLVTEGRGFRTAPPTLAPSSWTSCQQTVCTRAKDEAEGLGKLKLLRAYVTETVKLLDSLMESMDSELVKIAKEMKDFVSPRCEAAHLLLEQVAVAMPRRDIDLSAGIMEESTAQRVMDAQASGREELDDDIEQRGYDNDLQGWASPDTDSEEYPPSTGRGLSSGQQQSSFSSRKGIDERISSTSTSSGRGTENRANSVYSEGRYPGPQRWEGVTQDTRDGRKGPGAEGQQVGNRGQGRQLDQSTTGGTHHRGSVGGGGVSKGGSQRHDQTSSSNQYNSALAPTTNSGSRDVSGGNSWRAVPTGPNCRGRRGSPFAVPGIDTWCLQNCAAGYCPQTHCICE